MRFHLGSRQEGDHKPAFFRSGSLRGCFPPDFIGVGKIQFACIEAAVYLNFPDSELPQACKTRKQTAAKTFQAV
jgi:hypothetical protein